MKLWRVPKSWQKTQGFGENANASYAKDGLKGHTANDYVAPYDTPIPSLIDGEAKVTWIVNQHDTDFKYRSVFTCVQEGDTVYEVSYGHLNDIRVNVGDIVEPGTILGTMGNTGQVYTGGVAVSVEDRKNGSRAGTHLHGPQVRVCTGNLDTYAAKNYGNGFNGCVDPEQFFLPYSIDEKEKVAGILQSIISLYQKIIASLKK